METFKVHILVRIFYDEVIHQKQGKRPLIANKFIIHF